MSVYLYLKFGPSSLIGIAVMILFLPIQVKHAASRKRFEFEFTKLLEIESCIEIAHGVLFLGSQSNHIGRCHIIGDLFSYV